MKRMAFRGYPLRLYLGCVLCLLGLLLLHGEPVVVTVLGYALLGGGLVTLAIALWDTVHRSRLIRTGTSLTGTVWAIDPSIGRIRIGGIFTLFSPYYARYTLTYHYSYQGQTYQAKCKIYHSDPFPLQIGNEIPVYLAPGKPEAAVVDLPTAIREKLRLR